ncbi:MAG: glycerol-3-phosphate 1-O-acyltransferase PlsY, partial [Gemmatimonadaceae bacterium]
FVAALLVVAAYLVGSFPTAYLVGKGYGIDLRTVGSGNLGATNVLRSIGWKAGLLVYVVDMVKGVLPVVLFPTVASVAKGWPWGVVFGIAAIMGHVRPIFLLGKGGGKGVATASGVFLGLAPIPALIAFVVFVVVTSVSRYVSLGSLIGAVSLVIAMWFQEAEFSALFIVTATVAAFVFYTHRANIARLRSGTENKIGHSSKLNQVDTVEPSNDASHTLTNDASGDRA